MKSVGKIIGILAAVLVALVIALFVLVKVYVTPERIKEVLLPKAQETLHRQVTLGEIDVSLFSGIVLHDLGVQEKQGAESFVAADRVILRYQLWPLLFRRVVVDEIRIDSPRVRIERFADGTFNFSDLVTSPEAPAEPPPAREDAGGGPVDLLVSQISVNGGDVLFLDHAMGEEAPYRFEIRGFDFSARSISLDSAFPWDLKAQIGTGSVVASGTLDLQSRRGELKMEISSLDVAPFTPYLRDKIPGRLNSMVVSANVTAEGGSEELASRGGVMLDKIDMVLETQGGKEPVALKDASLGLEYVLNSDLKKETATLGETTLTFNAIPVKVSGTVQNFSAPQVDLQLTVPDLDLRPALKALPPSLLPTAVAELDPAGVVSVQAHLKGAVAEPKELLEEGTVRLGQIAANVGEARATVDGRLHIQNDTLTSENLTLQMGENRANLDVKVTELFSDLIRVHTALRADRFALDPLLKTSAAPAAPTGSGPSEQPPVANKPASPREPLKPPVVAEGTVRIGQTVYKGLTVQDFSMRYLFDQGILTVPELTGKVAGGTFGLEARADLSRETPPFDVDVNLKGLQADPLVSAFFPKASQVVFGNLNLETHLEGKGLDPEVIKRNLSGTGSLLLADGKLTGAGLVQNLSEFLNLEELRVLRFSQAKGSFTVKNGKLEIDSDINGQDIRMRPQGTISLTDYALDLSLKPLFSPELTRKIGARGDLAKFLVNEQGWGRIPVEVDGTLSSPRFHLDTTAVRQQLKEKAGEEVRKGVEKGLQKLLPKPKEGEEPTPAQPGRQMLEEKLKGLFGQ